MKKGILVLVILIIIGCSHGPPPVPTAAGDYAGSLPSPTGTWLPSEMVQPTPEASATATPTATPTLDQTATAVVAALATENARLVTQVATLAVPTPTPTPNLGKLAYVQGGDIWVKVLPDEEPQRLTTDARNHAPRWSPSGEWLAFRKGEYEQVWVMRADGGDTRSLMATPKGAFAWSPVADRLAYAANDELQVVHADGSNPVTVVARRYGGPPTPPPQEEGRIGRIAWSPDGTWMAYEWELQQLKQPLSYQGLWKVAVGGGDPIELYASGAPEKGEAILAGWSLDGQHILFWQGDTLSASILADGAALYSLPASGGEPIKLAQTVLVHDDSLAPAQQGDRLAVTAGSYRATWTNKCVAVIEARGGELTWLTDESVAAFSPAWSPDGVHLAYAAMPDRGDLVGGEDARLGMMERGIWVANAQGQPRLQRLTRDLAYRDERPLWSADGSHILFARMDAEDRASMWLIPAEGGEPRQAVDELTPLPGPAPGWFGYYGHVDWDELFDWWLGPVKGTEGIIVPPGPAPKATLIATPKSTTLPPTTTTTTPSPTSTPTTTLDPTVATAFPLEVGATWRYQAHIEEELGGKVQVRDETITQRVISQTQQASDTIFTLERAGGLNPGRFYYLVWGTTASIKCRPRPGTRPCSASCPTCKAMSLPWHRATSFPCTPGQAGVPLGRLCPTVGTSGMWRGRRTWMCPPVTSRAAIAWSFSLIQMTLLAGFARE